MTSLVEHARHELELAKESPEMIEAIVSVVETFASSPLTADGTTSAMAATMVHHLLRRRPLTPLTDDPNEWVVRESPNGAKIWQNTRSPEAFSTDGGKSYWSLSEISPEGERIIRKTASKIEMTRAANITEMTEKMSKQGEDEE